MSARVEKEGPISEWLESVFEVDGYVSGSDPVVMEGETLIDFKDDLLKFDHSAKNEEQGFRANRVPNAFTEKGKSNGLSDSTSLYECLNPEATAFKPDELGRPGERERRRGSLGSHGRKASNEARSEWDIFFDRVDVSTKV